MPSDHRLHPTSILFALAGSLRAFLLPAIVLMLTTAADRADSPRAPGGFGPGRWMNRWMPGDFEIANWQFWLLLFLIPSTIAAVARYLSFRLRYEGTELVIRSGHHLPQRAPRAVCADPEPRRGEKRRAPAAGRRRGAGRDRRRPDARGDDPRPARDGLRGDAPAYLRGPGARTSRCAAAGDTGGRGPGRSNRERSCTCRCARSCSTACWTTAACCWSARPTACCGRRGCFAASGIRLARGAYGPGLVRDTAQTIAAGGVPSLTSIAVLLVGIIGLLLLVRLLSMIWSGVRLHDFRLTRVGDDLRTEYGLLTRVTATIPLRRVQSLTIREAPLQRLVKRMSVRVETAGGTGMPAGRTQTAARVAGADHPAGRGARARARGAARARPGRARLAAAAPAGVPPRAEAARS